MVRLLPIAIGLFILLMNCLFDSLKYDFFISGSEHVDVTQMNKYLNRAKKPEEVVNWLLDLPWTKSVKLTRAGLEDYFVNVEEHQPKALWRIGGVISDAGDLYFPETRDIPKGLSVIDAPVSKISEGIWIINTLENDLVAGKLWPIRLYQFKAGDWVVELPKHRQFIFGTRDLENRINVCKKILPKLILSNNEWGRVDFRYPKAFAISKNSL